MASVEAGGTGTAAAGAALIAVEVAYAAAPHQIDRVALCLPAGSTALQALRASGLADRLGAAALDALTLGLWGRTIEPGTVLRDRDRLELLRPLVVDPKEARRQRYRRDGLKKPRQPGPR
jgi:putative ubiquitin-RnfH superfamily antitoxin RatB of RatAB toxin-antitoxin module